MFSDRTVAAFVAESQRRLDIIEGRRTPSDLHPLYHKTTKLLAHRDVSKRLLVTPNLYMFRAAFRAFAGRVADIALPSGAFFGGSAVLAAATAAHSGNATMVRYLTRQAFQESVEYKQKFMCLCRKCGRAPLALRILSCLGPAAGLIDPEELRANIVDIHGEGEHPTDEDDCFHLTNNGFGPYSRSDVDIFVCADTIEEGDAKVKTIYRRMLATGEECAFVKTPNSVTVCRGWPERHVQIVVLVMEQVWHHLLFCDLDCTAMAYMGGEVYTNTRSRRALTTGCNWVPMSMLLNRHDTPKRVAAYHKRGFEPRYLPDDTMSREQLHRIEALALEVETEVAKPGKKLFDFYVLADHDDWEIECEDVVEFLMQHNTAYQAWNVPRMVGLEAVHIHAYYRRLDERALQRGGELVTALVHSEHDIPSTLFKLAKSRRELWVLFGLVAEDPNRRS